jgi:hypothetical protein
MFAIFVVFVHLANEQDYYFPVTIKGFEAPMYVTVNDSFNNGNARLGWQAYSLTSRNSEPRLRAQGLCAGNVGIQCVLLCA